MLAAALAVLLPALPPASPPGPQKLHDPADSVAIAADLVAVQPVPAPARPAALTAADLAPLFASGLAAEGKASYDAGRFEEAAQRLARVPGPEAAYVRALALIELDRHGAALAALDGLEAKLPDLADRVLFLRGQELAAAGRKVEAVEAWSAVPDGSLLASDARLGRARLSAATGQKDVALTALVPLLGGGAPIDPARPDSSASALLLAGQIQAAGPRADPGAARGLFLTCWSSHPLSPEAADCLAALKALPGRAGAPPSAEDSLRRAERLLDRNRNEAAIVLLEPLAAASRGAEATGPQGCRIRAALGRGYRKERIYGKAIDTLRPVVESCQDAELRVRSLYLLASATSIAGDRDEALGLYRRLAAEFPGHGLADDALLFASDLLARAGREEEAREALAELIRVHPAGDYRWEARFRLAWLSRRAGQGDAAVAQFLAMEEAARGQDPYEEARAAYWRARLLAGSGEAGGKAARGIWKDLATRYTTDYYGLLSRARLAEVGVELPLPVAPPPSATARGYDPGPLRDDPHFRAGLLLARMGLARAASAELAAISSARLRGGPDTAVEPVVLVADLLDRCGDHQAAHNLLRSRARTALRQPPTTENLRAWRIAYPAAYRDEIARFAPPAGVPVDLLQGLMREESALDPRVISPAGAVGLTQLMLPTAQSVATRYKLRRPARGDLMVPAVNIQLGARYLGELIRRFDGQVPLALAAYNAGSGAVGRWLDARGHLALDEFVEEIPIEETRGYVKRVLRSYAAYRLLYGGGGAAQAGELLRVAG